MTERREFAQTSANDDRPPEIRIERISTSRLIEALCDEGVPDDRSPVANESATAPQVSRSKTGMSATGSDERSASDRAAVRRVDRR